MMPFLQYVHWKLNIDYSQKESPWHFRHLRKVITSATIYTMPPSIPTTKGMKTGALPQYYFWLKIPEKFSEKCFYAFID